LKVIFMHINSNSAKRPSLELKAVPTVPVAPVAFVAASRLTPPAADAKPAAAVKPSA